MANNESALNMVGLVEASDYLASLLARLAALEQGNGVAAVSALPELLAAQPDPRSLYFGTPQEYGDTHQLGRPEINPPERRALGLSEGDKQSVLETLEGYLVSERL
ncbi:MULTISPECIES: phage virion morphogenesis protein [Aeromonas]|uniref:phage virion morphogenesis protein n=1 Tax=Aeromonas TaxID=642 RepID=UPI00207C5DB5|nr:MULTISPECIES: phage virion morphogenesis protein [Aeromonas]MCO4208539.1 phage virion morphogenesis protein [Aeromonas hydrophila]WAF78922.1 phage virion morphogenesis protein [Aeromonas dhakensis]